MQVVGVDVCRGGWIAVAWDTEIGMLYPSIHLSFEALVDAFPDDTVIGIDIPIGLSKGKSRQCDIEARRILRHRHPCVFDAPDPLFIDAPTYEDALFLATKVRGKGITKQAFAIYPKIAEVNRAMPPSLQNRVVEIHPEISFCALAGRPLEHPKRKQAGYDERRALLEEALEVLLWPRKEAFKIARPAKPDDLLDGTGAAWTARRVAEGTAERLPVGASINRRGLRMEMVY